MGKPTKIFNDVVIKDEMSKIRALNAQIKDLQEKAKAKVPFKEGEKVAVMDLESRKFKRFAFINDIYTSGNGLFVRMQDMTKHGKKEKRIDTLSPMEYIIPSGEADENDKYVAPDMSKLRLDDSKF
jgi:hypothetical protein